MHKTADSYPTADGRGDLPDHLIKPVERGVLGSVLNWIGMTLTHIFIHLEGHGLENIPQQTPYVLASNHETFVDGMWIGSFLPRWQFKKYSCLAAQDLLTDYGLFGKVIMKVGRGIPLNRKGNPIRGLVTAKKQVDDGNILMVHPEGTRSHDGHLSEIQEGACYIAKKAHVPVVPVFIDGGYEIFNRYRKCPSWWDPKRHARRRLIVRFGRPLLPDDYKNAREMTQALRDWMQQAFKEKEVPRDFSMSSAAQA
ncbi:MAG: lysophospholipid acyltransferase family protein [Oscillospiraceae bacterium]|nr:lysophospholipid acyltransferase family protein [Oscillospiraceae bacterium]MDD4367735.1 lysophospholipid acyltransferase family protein [Oscillospiraceae bacterium]